MCKSWDTMFPCKDCGSEIDRLSTDYPVKQVRCYDDECDRAPEDTGDIAEYTDALCDDCALVPPSVLPKSVQGGC